MSNRVGLLLAACSIPSLLSAETVTWEARALLGPGTSVVAGGTKTYQTAADIVVQEGRSKDGAAPGIEGVVGQVHGTT